MNRIRCSPAVPLAAGLGRRCVHSLLGHISQRLRPPNNSYEVIETVGNVSPSLTPPPHIVRPEYVSDDGEPLPHSPQVDGNAVPKLPDELIGIMRASEAAADALVYAGKIIEESAPGITTDSLDAAVHEYIIAKGGYPSPLQYLGFPKSICTSVNNVVVHGIPDDRPLKVSHDCQCWGH